MAKEKNQLRVEGNATYTQQLVDQIGCPIEQFTQAVNEVSTGGGGGGVSYASQLPMSATDTTKTETAINNNKGQIDGLEVTVGLLADDVSDVITDLDTNYTDTTGINTLLADYETTLHASSTYLTVANANTTYYSKAETNTAISTAISNISKSSIATIINSSPSIALTTTTFPVVGTALGVAQRGSNITANATAGSFTFHNAGFANFFLTIRGTASGSGQYATFTLLKNGVAVGSKIKQITTTLSTNFDMIALNIPYVLNDVFTCTVTLSNGTGTLTTTAPNNAIVFSANEVL